MKVVQINATCGTGSTGKIAVEISRLLSNEGIENYIMYTSGDTDYPLGIKFGSAAYIKFQSLKSRILGNWGFNSKMVTKRMIEKLDEIEPDIVHLHNLHGHSCDLELLFRYIKNKKIKVLWTFHDCWAFTGYCAHFTVAKCERWRSDCVCCPQKQESSWFFDRSKTMFERKKNLFMGLDMTIITPSQWLADLVKDSFLKDYPVRVINNGIDLNVFKPTESDFRQKHCLEGKKLVLGVAFGWGARKGLDIFIELAKRLDDRYQIVLVGTDEVVNKQLPANIISVHRTQNQRELAEIYTAADVFVNPTREENYPTVNMEALACGTPVITFKTGGSPETLNDTCGSVVEVDNASAMEREIIHVCEEHPYSKKSCTKCAEAFDAAEKFAEYIRVYKETL